MTDSPENVSDYTCASCGQRIGKLGVAHACPSLRELTAKVERYEAALSWIARPHGLTAKRCPVRERLQEAEDIATAALAADTPGHSLVGSTCEKCGERHVTESGYITCDADTNSEFANPPGDDPCFICGPTCREPEVHHR